LDRNGQRRDARVGAEDGAMGVSTRWRAPPLSDAEREVLQGLADGTRDCCDHCKSGDTADCDVNPLVDPHDKERARRLLEADQK
jgi:hypothetical protein